MKPNGHIQPQRDLPMSTPVIRNEAKASQGKRTMEFHPVNMNWMAVRESPTVLGLSPHVHRTGKRSGKAPRLNIMALNSKNERI